MLNRTLLRSMHCRLVTSRPHFWGQGEDQQRSVCRQCVNRVHTVFEGLGKWDKLFKDLKSGKTDGPGNFMVFRAQGKKY